MAIDWSKARQMMTSNPAYRGTRSPTLGANQGKGGQGNFRRTGSRPGPGGGPIPTRQQVATNRRIATPRGVGDFAKGIYNTGKDVAGKFMHPAMMLANSIGANQAQHDYLDDVYGDAKGMALWAQAGDNYYDRAKRAGTLDDQGQPLRTGYGMSFADMEPGGGGTLGGTSMGQAQKYFKMAGLTDNDLNKFFDKDYKFGGNEAWLRSQAQDKEKFDTGMSFIKNAKSTANLARATQAMEDAAYDGPGQTTGAAGGPIPDMDITSDIAPKEKPRYVNPGQTDGPVGMGLMPNMQMNYEPLTAAGSGMISGYNRPEPGPFEYLPLYSSPWDFNFTPENYEYGLYPPDQAYPGGGPSRYPGATTNLRQGLYDQTGGSPTMGGNLASQNALGMRGYDVNDQGTIMPNITVEFGPYDDEEQSGKINPSWNNPKGRLGLYGN